MRQFRKYLKFAFYSTSTVACTFAVKTFFDQTQTQPLKASWTTNFVPSVKWDHNWDKRDPASIQRTKSEKDLKIIISEDAKNLKSSADDSSVGNKKLTKARRHLFLIRHGQYEINQIELDKRVLTKLGREQAEFSGKRLKELATNFKYTKLHHSTIIRAMETAEIVNKQINDPAIPVHSDPLLCEGAPIPPEPPVDHWMPDIHEFFQDGSRIEAAFRKYFYRPPPDQLEDTYEIIVCHGNVIRYFFCRALQFPPEAWLRFDVGHGSITHIVIKADGKVGCKTLGEVGFMPISKVTS